MTALTLNLNALDLSEDQYFQLCEDNRDLRLERTAAGELIIMPPTGGETSRRNAKITQQLLNWAEGDGTGIAFDSSGGFKLPNGADRSPDASWITQERWDALTAEQKQKFLPLCPDFVVELLSPSDSLTATQDKMQEYRHNGARLGWLINPRSRQIEIYRLDCSVEVLESPLALSGEAVLPGFVLNLQAFW